MDWITLTKQQVEEDTLPPVCMVCGGPATCRVNKTFEYTPEWVAYLYFAGILPGVIAQYFLEKEMRVACPFCRGHQNHWRKLIWIASIGWLLALLLAGLGYGAGSLIGSTSDRALYIGAGVGSSLGLITWLVVVSYLASTRIKATKITNDEITLQRLADGFVRAVKDQQRPTLP